LRENQEENQKDEDEPAHDIPPHRQTGFNPPHGIERVETHLQSGER
jgi:hypothetical protein